MIFHIKYHDFHQKIEEIKEKGYLGIHFSKTTQVPEQISSSSSSSSSISSSSSSRKVPSFQGDSNGATTKFLFELFFIIIPKCAVVALIIMEGNLVAAAGGWCCISPPCRPGAGAGGKIMAGFWKVGFFYFLFGRFLLFPFLSILAPFWSSSSSSSSFSLDGGGAALKANCRHSEDTLGGGCQYAIEEKWLGWMWQ